jgi:hypothetical protein
VCVERLVEQLCGIGSGINPLTFAEQLVERSFELIELGGKPLLPSDLKFELEIPKIALEFLLFGPCPLDCSGGVLVQHTSALGVEVPKLLVKPLEFLIGRCAIGGGSSLVLMQVGVGIRLLRCGEVLVGASEFPLRLLDSDEVLSCGRA